MFLNRIMKSAQMWLFAYKLVLLMRTQKSLTMRTREGVCFSCSDHLGSTSLTVNINALVTSQTGYMPWGGVEESTGSSPTDYGYTGQMREGDIYYYGARWPKVPEAKLKGFDPSIGRFMQADTIVPLPVRSPNILISPITTARQRLCA